MVLSKERIANVIYDDEQMIEKGHNPLNYFWIMPKRVIDYQTNTCVLSNLEECSQAEISIREDVFEDLLYRFFVNRFDNGLPENRGRGSDYLPEHYKNGKAFEWYLTDNFYTFDAIEGVLEDIRIAVRQNTSLGADTLVFYRQFDELIREMIREGQRGGYYRISVCGP